jgi:very-short-patch-repair endonuclease
MYDPKIHNLEKFKMSRRKLRSFGTKPEEVLWEKLRNNTLGVRFRRQFGIKNYIVDFCCWKEMLVIEIDGSIHNDPKIKENDSVRQKYLEALGFRVLRFSNSEVLRNSDVVIEKIRIFLQKFPFHPPRPSLAPPSPSGEVT